MNSQILLIEQIELAQIEQIELAQVSQDRYPDLRQEHLIDLISSFRLSLKIESQQNNTEILSFLENRSCFDRVDLTNTDG